MNLSSFVDPLGVDLPDGSPTGEPHGEIWQKDGIEVLDGSCQSAEHRGLQAPSLSPCSPFPNGACCFAFTLLKRRAIGCWAATDSRVTVAPIFS